MIFKNIKEKIKKTIKEFPWRGIEGMVVTRYAVAHGKKVEDLPEWWVKRCHRYNLLPEMMDFLASNYENKKLYIWDHGYFERFKQESWLMDYRWFQWIRTSSLWTIDGKAPEEENLKKLVNNVFTNLVMNCAVMKEDLSVIQQ